MVPGDFPHWSVLYSYWRKWTVKTKDEEESLLQRLLKKNNWVIPKHDWKKRGYKFFNY